MKKRYLLGPLVGIAALYAIGLGMRLSDDMRRYNRILAISGDEPLSKELPKLCAQVLIEERATVREWIDFLLSVPGDLARYLRMESM